MLLRFVSVDLKERFELQRDTATPDNSEAVEESLDPQDWGEIRSLGHRMLDDMLDYLSTVRHKPAWQPVPESV